MLKFVEVLENVFQNCSKRDSYNLRVWVYVSTHNDTNVDAYIYIENEYIKCLNFDTGNNDQNRIYKLINATISNTKSYPHPSNPNKPHAVYHPSYKFWCISYTRGSYLRHICVTRTRGIETKLISINYFKTTMCLNGRRECPHSDDMSPWWPILGQLCAARFHMISLGILKNIVWSAKIYSKSFKAKQNLDKWCPADARPSAGTKMTKFAFVYIGPGIWRIKMDVLV